MATTYYILDENQKAQKVSEREQEIWIEKNVAKYNRHKKFDGGSKDNYLRFVGTKETGQGLVLFEVETFFWDSDGEIITHSNNQFSNYEEALESYEEYLFLNEG